MGQEVSHTSPSGYVPLVGLCRSPLPLGLILTHIFGKSLDKGIAKAESISISPIAIVLPDSFTKSVCKMWVKDRSLGMGYFTMKKLRGRNLAHPGCLIGITAGLILGIVLAGIMALFFDVGLTVLLLIWFGLTLGLGAVGWIIGDRLSSRFPALEEDTTSTEAPPP